MSEPTDTTTADQLAAWERQAGGDGDDHDARESLWDCLTALRLVLAERDRLRAENERLRVELAAERGRCAAVATALHDRWRRGYKTGHGPERAGSPVEGKSDGAAVIAAAIEDGLTPEQAVAREDTPNG